MRVRHGPVALNLCRFFFGCCWAVRARYLVVADSDTIIFPERIIASLRLHGRDAQKPVVYGNTYHVRAPTLPHFTSLLGGAGIILSKGAREAINIDDCVAKQVEDLAWSTAPADWRIGLCYNRKTVTKYHAQYMYQSNEQLNCLPNGGGLRDCAWGGHYDQTMSDCPLSLHYQTPKHMKELFAGRTSKDGGGVCVPASSWRQFTSKCDCVTSQEAAAMAWSSARKQVAQKVTGNQVFVAHQRVIEATAAEVIKRMQGDAGALDKTRDVRHSVEEVFETPLFSQRKLISAVMDDISAAARKAGIAKGFSKPGLDALVADALADPSSATASFLSSKQAKHKKNQAEAAAKEARRK